MPEANRRRDTLLFMTIWPLAALTTVPPSWLTLAVKVSVPWLVRLTLRRVLPLSDEVPWLTSVPLPPIVLSAIVPVPWMINVLSSVFPAPVPNVAVPVIVMAPAPASVPELKVRPPKVIDPAPPNVAPTPARVRVDGAPMTDADDTFSVPLVIARSSSPLRIARLVVTVE